MRAWCMWAWYHISYLLHPYDMLADRRRWFWQRRQRCGFYRDGSDLRPEHNPATDDKENGNAGHQP